MIRSHLAWLLFKKRLAMLTMDWPKRLRTRDFVGTLIADVVAAVGLLWTAVTGRSKSYTEIERRATVCARRRLLNTQTKEQ